MVPYRGPVNATVLDVLGGLRSTCTCVFARASSSSLALAFRGVGLLRRALRALSRSVSLRYVGASRLKELPRRTTFVRVTQQLNEVFGQEQKPPVAPELTAIAAPPAAPPSEAAAKRARTG